MTPQNAISSGLIQFLVTLEKQGIVTINREWLQRKATGEPARKERE